MEHLNDNIDWQLFCAIYLGCKQLENLKIISEVRDNLAKKLDTDTIFKAHLLTRTRTKLAFLCAKKIKNTSELLKTPAKMT